MYRSGLAQLEHGISQGNSGRHLRSLSGYILCNLDTNKSVDVQRLQIELGTHSVDLWDLGELSVRSSDTHLSTAITPEPDFRSLLRLVFSLNKVG